MDLRSKGEVHRILRDVRLERSSNIKSGIAISGG